MTTSEKPTHFIAAGWECDVLHLTARCTFDLDSPDRPCRWFGEEATEDEIEAFMNDGTGDLQQGDGGYFKFTPGICAVVETLKEVGDEGIQPIGLIRLPEIEINVEDWDEGVCVVSAVDPS